MIIGIDWLEAHNPMKVDWLQKWMIIDYFGCSVQLIGLQSSLPACSVLELLFVPLQDPSVPVQCMVQTEVPEPVK
jgi:hypothetical protein